MKEYSFSMIMAKWLSYEDNTSLQYNIKKGFVSWPDENVSTKILESLPPTCTVSSLSFILFYPMSVRQGDNAAI